jgi:hypothetical protein
MFGIASALLALAGQAAWGDRPTQRRAQEVERIDPVAAADAFAGDTIRDRQAGLQLIQGRAKNAPRVGQVAPDFELKTADGKETIRLSSFRGRKPVVLIFGSHT